MGGLLGIPIVPGGDQFGELLAPVFAAWASIREMASHAATAGIPACGPRAGAQAARGAPSAGGSSSGSWLLSVLVALAGILVAWRST